MVRSAIEDGQVIETGRGRARVRLNRNDSCLACGLCLFGRDGRGMILEAENAVGAAAGDRVEVEMERRDPLAGAFLLFGLPLLAMLAGAGTGYFLAGQLGFSLDGGAVLLAALFLSGAFLLIRRREARRRERAGERIRLLRVVSGPAPSAPGIDQGREGGAVP